MSVIRCVQCCEYLACSKVVPLMGEKLKALPVVPRQRASVHSPMKRASSFHSLHQSSIRCGLGIPMQVRMVHTDVTNIPDFTPYRVQSAKEPTSDSQATEMQKKVYGYTMMFAGAALATTAAKYTVKTFIMPLGPTGKTLAEASTEVSLSSIPEGKNMVVKWRNKPLFVRHRSQEEIDRERAVPISSLRHQETDESRVQQAKWLVCVGVCTHLGCVPIANAGEFPGGFYCPCHGSHYDASGRIRKGPAPLNLEIPQYEFVDDSTIVVG